MSAADIVRRSRSAAGIAESIGTALTSSVVNMVRPSLAFYVDRNIRRIAQSFPCKTEPTIGIAADHVIVAECGAGAAVIFIASVVVRRAANSAPIRRHSP